MCAKVGGKRERFVGLGVREIVCFPPSLAFLGEQMNHVLFASGKNGKGKERKNRGESGEFITFYSFSFLFHGKWEPLTHDSFRPRRPLCRYVVAGLAAAARSRMYQYVPRRE